MALGADTAALLILAGCVLFFLTRWLPASVTGVAGCLLMVLFGVCSYEDAFSGFSSSIVMLMASAMIVGIAMFKTGVAPAIGRLAIRLSGGEEKRFLMSMCLIGGILSMFLANTAIIAVFFPIIESVAEESQGRMNRLRLVLPMALAVMIGGASTLVGCTPQLTANGILTSLTGEEMTMWTLTAPAACIFLLYLLYMALFGGLMGRRIFQDREGKPMELAEESGKKPEGGKNKKAVPMVFILVFMIASYILGCIPAAYTAMISALLCIAAGCCSVRDVVRELQWETVVFLASCLGLAQALILFFFTVFFAFFGDFLPAGDLSLPLTGKVRPGEYEGCILSCFLRHLLRMLLGFGIFPEVNQAEVPFGLRPVESLNRNLDLTLRLDFGAFILEADVQEAGVGDLPLHRLFCLFQAGGILRAVGAEFRYL